MKKFLLFLAGSCMLLAAVSAQGNRNESTNDRGQGRAVADSKERKEVSKKDTTERKNFFVGITGKVHVYVNDNAKDDINVWKNPTFGGNVFVGKWFNQYLSSRVVLEYGTIKPSFQKRRIITDEKYVLGRLDVLFDVTNCFRSYSPDRFYNLIPYAGIGMARAFDAHNRPDGATGSTSLVIGGGLWNTFRMSEKFSAFLNLGVDIMTADFDGYIDRKYNAIAAGSIGLMMNF